MMTYAFLTVGTLGTAACMYAVAPAGPGAHRLVMTRRQLRADCARRQAEAEELSCKLVGLASEHDAVTAERDEAREQLGNAEQLVADLEEQLRTFDATCAENTQLRADLANARAMRQLTAAPSPAPDASALPDDVQEFVDQTATAWRKSA